MEEVHAKIEERVDLLKNQLDVLCEKQKIELKMYKDELLK